MALAALVCGVCTDVALAMDHRNVVSRPSIPADFTDIGDATIYNATFEQLIDHDNPSLGTFSQFYYYSIDYWKGPGSPVVSSSIVQSQMILPSLFNSIVLISCLTGLFYSRRSGGCRLSAVSTSHRLLGITDISEVTSQTPEQLAS